MIRLNGDIIKQLENLYRIKFFSKYKEELKERIIFFLNQKLREFVSDDVLGSIKNMNEIILFVDNEPNLIRESFIKQYKEEIFNSFNPLWYEASNKPDEHISKKEYNIQMYLIKLEIADRLDNLDLIVPESRLIHSFASLEYRDAFRSYEKKELSSKMYFKIEKDLEREFKRCDFKFNVKDFKHKLNLFKSFMLEHTKENKMSSNEIESFFLKNDFISLSEYTNLPFYKNSKQQFFYSFFIAFLVHETLEFIKIRNKNTTRN